ncbi:plant expansin, partial [Pseudovirgaria hyperparasitica]
STLHTGDLTYYDPGLGACGITSAPTDPIVAISHDLFDAYMPVGASNPNLNPLCGREIEIFRNPAGGVAAGVADGNPDGGVKTMIVKVVDRCTGCAPTDLDVPKMVHEFFVADSTFEGRVEDMQWRW